MQIVRCFENCPSRFLKGIVRGNSIQSFYDHCRVSDRQLEFKGVTASPREVVQFGKGATNGIALATQYGSSRGGIGRDCQFDRQTSALLANYLESRIFECRLMFQAHR
jgi:hypothetical protein